MLCMNWNLHINKNGTPCTLQSVSLYYILNTNEDSEWSNTIEITHCAPLSEPLHRKLVDNRHWLQGGTLGYNGGRETWFVPGPYMTCPKDKGETRWLLSGVLVAVLSYAKAHCPCTSPQVVSPGPHGPVSFPPLSTGQLPQKWMPLVVLATGARDSSVQFTCHCHSEKDKQKYTVCSWLSSSLRDGTLLIKSRFLP